MNDKNAIEIYDGAIVKSYKYGDTLELTTANGLQPQVIRILENKRYLNLLTGEIKDFDTSAKNRNDNLKTTKQTMKSLRRLIAHNFTGGDSQLWITLTYREHITDPAIASRDFKIFMKNLRKNYEQLDYISVVEPQLSGRWHYHVLLKGTSTLIIPNRVIEKAWGRGFTKTKRLKNSDKVGNYVTSYLTNLDVPQSAEKKKIIKGARLYLYPKGLRIYRRSKGIENPIELTAKKESILEEYALVKKADFVKKTVHQTLNGEVAYITEFFDNIDDDRHSEIIKNVAITPTKANDDNTYKK